MGVRSSNGRDDDPEGGGQFHSPNGRDGDLERSRGDRLGLLAPGTQGAGFCEEARPRRVVSRGAKTGARQGNSEVTYGVSIRISKRVAALRGRLK